MLELFSLEGRTALITGGNGGLGRAMALGLQAAGAQVVVTGRNPEKNEAIGAELGDPSAVYSLDVRDEDAVERTVAQVVERSGRIDILVNNAGVVRLGSVLELSPPSTHEESLFSLTQDLTQDRKDGILRKRSFCLFINR